MFTRIKQMLKDTSGIEALNLLLTGGIMLVIVTITLAIGAQILSSIGSGFTAGTNPAYIVNNGTYGIVQLASQMGLIGLVIALTVVLLILLTLLFNRIGGAVR